MQTRMSQSMASDTWSARPILGTRTQRAACMRCVRRARTLRLAQGQAFKPTCARAACHLCHER